MAGVLIFFWIRSIQTADRVSFLHAVRSRSANPLLCLFIYFVFQPQTTIVSCVSALNHVAIGGLRFEAGRERLPTSSGSIRLYAK